MKEEQKRKLEEQLGQTPNGRKFYAAALIELQAERWDAAARALRSALMYEPGNAGSRSSSRPPRSSST